MKKILISTVIILLIIMACLAIFKGISIFGIEILSIEQISNENDKLTEEIAATEILMNNDYALKTAQLEKSISDLLVAKEEYWDLASVSTEGELKRASQEEEYTVEFLLTSLGRHTTSEGVNLDYTISTGTTGQADLYNVKFNVTGDYIPIINFVTAIEDDDKLGFRIQNFKITPGGQNLAASFLVTNVKIKNENLTSGKINNTDTTTQTTTDVETNTNNTNTNNTENTQSTNSQTNTENTNS